MWLHDLAHENYGNFQRWKNFDKSFYFHNKPKNTVRNG